jgi:hypothetical protein
LRRYRLNPQAASSPDGEMEERTLGMDWSSALVGAFEGWPQKLKNSSQHLLGSRHPIVIWWGGLPYTQFYNDAYASLLGHTKQPFWLGRSGRDCWK